MITLIKALLKLHMQLDYIINGVISQDFILILIRCCIILCITTTKLNLRLVWNLRVNKSNRTLSLLNLLQ